jgi:hypothetical protein
MTGANESDDHDPGFMLRAALAGFDGARHRLNGAAVPGVPPESVYVPLAEALWWAVIVDNGFEELADARELSNWPTKKQYQDARNTDPSGRVLVGLRYARDRCGHQPALIALEDGLRLPFRLPNAFGVSFRWLPSDQLPQPQQKNHQKRAKEMRPAYNTWLAGRPAAMTVESAAMWFTRAAEEADTYWLPAKSVHSALPQGTSPQP